MFLIPKILTMWKAYLYPFLPGLCNEFLGSDKLLQGRNQALFIPVLRTWAAQYLQNKVFFLFGFTFYMKHP